MYANVKEFGAAGDGVCVDTGAIQRAIDAGESCIFRPEPTGPERSTSPILT